MSNDPRDEGDLDAERLADEDEHPEPDSELAEADDDDPPPRAGADASRDAAGRDPGRDKDDDRRKRKKRAASGADAPEDREGFWERSLGRRLEGIVPDVVKRTLVGSVGSLFMSEDGLKQALTELRLPKEIVTFILQHADNTKREFMRLVARELREFLETTNFYDELRKILTGLSFEIRTEVRLIPNDNAFVKPDIKNTVRVKKQRDDKEDEE